jgi:L-methionine (R)-S-oxide reductase
LRGVNDFRDALEALDRILDRGGDADDVLREVVALLHDRFEHYSWVGVYLVEGDDLVLGPWRGPEATEHVRIPVGQGICGAAAASGRTEIVDDVNADSRYLACFPSTRSEIVVPISFEGRVVGEIDIDSDEPAAFGEGDRGFLERVATLISPHCLVGWDTGGERWAP